MEGYIYFFVYLYTDFSTTVSEIKVRKRLPTLFKSVLYRKYCIEICCCIEGGSWCVCCSFFKSVWNFTKKLITSDRLFLKKEGLFNLVWLKHVENEGYNHNKY